MNIIVPECKILEMSYYLLGKYIFKTCIKKKVLSIFLGEFCDLRKCSAAFCLKYCYGLTVEEIAEQLSYDVRSIYKQIDGDMSTFGRWLVYDCSEAKAFEQIRCRLETNISSEYRKREIDTTDIKAWQRLKLDCLQALF